MECEVTMDVCDIVEKFTDKKKNENLSKNLTKVIRWLIIKTECKTPRGYKLEVQ